VGERDLPGGARSSALKFWSDDRRAIIREGSGYWKYADVREWYDEKQRRFRIGVNVHNRTWGPLFGHRGSFEVEWLEVEPGA
jgi:hypothetical protein